MQMICPLDKFVILSRYLETWTATLAAPNPQLSLLDLERCVGLFQWLSAGFTAGRADIANVIHLKTAAKAVQERTGRAPGQAFIEMSKEKLGRAAASIGFWNEHFRSWDRTCSVVKDFSPRSSWEGRGRVDASTLWGCGGASPRRRL